VSASPAQALTGTNSRTDTVANVQGTLSVNNKSDEGMAPTIYDHHFHDIFMKEKRAFSCVAEISVAVG
jgi:hypothetical protein